MRVTGQLRRAGRPLAGRALTFLARDGDVLEERDWDFTDQDGRYEVELSAAHYVVQDEDGAEVTQVGIPLGLTELFLDLDPGRTVSGTLSAPAPNALDCPGPLSSRRRR